MSGAPPLFARRGEGAAPAFVGVVHLRPLPGAPRWAGDLDAVIARAVEDAQALAAGGADAAIIENLGDAPFAADDVEPVTVAAMTRVVAAVRAAVPELALGVNVLRNDGLAALSIAAVTGAAFVRVNVLSGVMVTDQGLVRGRARELLLLRRRLGADVAVVADVLVKHAVPLGPLTLEDAARDTWDRAGADALVVTGTGTGRPTDPGDLRRVRTAVPTAPVWLGSGLTADRAHEVRGLVDGVIVGTWLHRDGDLGAPLDHARVRTLADALRG